MFAGLLWRWAHLGSGAEEARAKPPRGHSYKGGGRGRSFLRDGVEFLAPTCDSLLRWGLIATLLKTIRNLAEKFEMKFELVSILFVCNDLS